MRALTEAGCRCPDEYGEGWRRADKALRERHAAVCVLCGVETVTAPAWAVSALARAAGGLSDAGATVTGSKGTVRCGAGDPAACGCGLPGVVVADLLLLCDSCSVVVLALRRAAASGASRADLARLLSEAAGRAVARACRGGVQ